MVCLISIPFYVDEQEVVKKLSEMLYWNLIWYHSKQYIYNFMFLYAKYCSKVIIFVKFSDEHVS